MFHPLPKTPEEMQPDDCRRCDGAGGVNVLTGCFGGREWQPCKTCRGQGKLAPNLQDAHDIDDKLAEIRKAIVATVLRTSGNYSDELSLLVYQYRTLEAQMTDILK